MREIPGYPGYKVTENGQVFSMKRMPNKPMRGNINAQGYHQMMLFINEKHTTTGAHRLVALAYVPNDDPSRKIQVHHKDHNKLNNHFSNLEWVTPSHNITMNYRTGGQIGKAGLKGIYGVKHPLSKIVGQFHPEDGLIQVFFGLREAAEATGSHAGHISGVCLGRHRTHNGFVWRFR